MRFVLISTLSVAALALSGCETLSLGSDDDVRARELGAECRPTRASEAAAPGDWICPDEPGDPDIRPGHRIRRDGSQYQG